MNKEINQINEWKNESWTNKDTNQTIGWMHE